MRRRKEKLESPLSGSTEAMPADRPVTAAL